MLHAIRTAAIATASAAVLFGAATAAQAGQTDFTLVNTSGYDIYYLYVSPDNADSWGDDVLGEQILPVGSSVEIGMDNFGSHCTFDIQVENAYGETFEMWGVDLCEYSEVYVQ